MSLNCYNLHQISIKQKYQYVPNWAQSEQMQQSNSLTELWAMSAAAVDSTDEICSKQIKNNVAKFLYKCAAVLINF